MFTTFYNKDMVEKFKLESPAKLALEGKWTLDKMIEMSKDVGSDLNNDGTKDRQDQYGMVMGDAFIDPFYFGAGLVTTTRDEDGMIVLSEDFGSEKTVALLEKLCNVFFTTDDNWIYSRENGSDNVFDHGNTMFFNHVLQYAATTLRNSDFDYGILPIAKWDDAQEDYYTVASFPYSLYGIPLDAPDADRAAAVLEALASEGYKVITPAVFEKAMKVKYSRDEESSQIYDIIRESMVYDFGRIFNGSLKDMTYSLFRVAVRENNPAWASIYAANKDTLVAGLEELMTKLTEE